MPRKPAQAQVVYVTAAPKKKVVRRKKPSTAMIKYISGNGDYVYGDKKNMGPFEKIGRSVGGVLGSAYLGKGGGKLGSKLGSYLHYIGKIFGSGDYVTSANNVKHNVLVNDNQIPQFASDKNVVRIRHREFLGDIISSSTANTFQIQSFSINPGLILSFPWLAEVCQSTFQQYRINGMVFEFRSMSADALNSTNTALGQIIMATDYDSKDLPFTSKAQMENTEFGVSVKPSSCAIHAIECARNLTSVSELYIRAGAVPAGADVRLYDMGTFYIATNGLQGTSVNCGELWVSYEIDLFKAIQQPPGYAQLTAHVNLAATDSTHPLKVDTSVNAIQPVFDTIGITLNSNQTSFSLPYNIPPKSYWEIYYSVRGVSTALVTSLQMIGSNGMTQSVKSILVNGTSNGYQSPGVGTSYTGTTIMTMNTFYYDGSGTLNAPPTISFTSTAIFPGAPVNGDLLVIMLPGNIL